MVLALTFNLDHADRSDDMTSTSTSTSPTVISTTCHIDITPNRIVSYRIIRPNHIDITYGTADRDANKRQQ
jgi:hypothetical protein